MKGLIVIVFVSFITLNVSAGRVFDEKSEAKKEILAKYNDAVALADTTLKSANNEKSLVNNKGEDDLKKHLNLKLNETKVEFEKDASAVIRTAIAQAKPVAVIYCIRKVLSSGYDKIAVLNEENLKNVYNVKIKKLEKIEFDVYAIKAISTGLKELVDQALNKIMDGSGVIQAVKKEAINRCESALLLLGEIEVCLHEPILSREYIKTRQEIDRKFRELKIKLNTELESCLK